MKVDYNNSFRIVSVLGIITFAILSSSTLNVLASPYQSSNILSNNNDNNNNDNTLSPSSSSSSGATSTMMRFKEAEGSGPGKDGTKRSTKGEEIEHIGGGVEEAPIAGGAVKKPKKTFQSKLASKPSTASSTRRNLPSISLPSSTHNCPPEKRKLMDVCFQLLDSVQDKSFYQRRSTSCSRLFADAASEDRTICNRLYTLFFEGPNADNIKYALNDAVWHKITCMRYVPELEDNMDCVRENPTGMTTLFFHGVGRLFPTHQAELGWITHYLNPFAYYKEIQKYINTVTQSVFFYTETLTRGWNDISLEVEYCAAIEKIKPDMIVTHSMGNAVIAAGIARGLPGCTRIGTASYNVLWLSLEAPWLGSEMTPFMEGQCKKKTDIIPAIYVVLMNMCKDGHFKHLAYKSLYPNFPNTIEREGDLQMPQITCPPPAPPADEETGAGAGSGEVVESDDTKPKGIDVTTVTITRRLGGAATAVLGGLSSAAKIHPRSSPQPQPRLGRSVDRTSMSTPALPRHTGSMTDTSVILPPLRVQYGKKQRYNALMAERKKAKPPCVTLQDIAQQKVFGSLCGFSPRFTRRDESKWESFFTIVGISGSVLSSIAADMGARWNGDEIISATSGNDGLVGAHSCMIPGQPYERVSTAKFYAFMGNHMEGKCVHVDDAADPSQQSCGWLLHWLGEGKKLRGITATGSVPIQEVHESILDPQTWGLLEESEHKPF